MLSLWEDVTSVPHNHRDRVMRLFGKICSWSEKLNGHFFAAWYWDSFWTHPCPISSLFFFLPCKLFAQKKHQVWKCTRKEKMFFINRQHWQVEQRLMAFSAQINNLLCVGVLFDGNHATVFVYRCSNKTHVSRLVSLQSRTMEKAHCSTAHSEVDKTVMVWKSETHSAHPQRADCSTVRGEPGFIFDRALTTLNASLCRLAKACV